MSRVLRTQPTSLKDRRREVDARAQLQELENLYGREGDTYPEAKIGKAYLDALHGNPDRARSTLQANDEVFNQKLSGSWRQLLDETREMLRNRKN